MRDLKPTIVVDKLDDDFKTDWGVEAINAPKVWEHTKGEGVKVVVIDTGIDMEHEDFTGRIKGTINAFDKSTTLITDNVGHGTHVAGLIAGAKTGVAPEAELYVSNVLDPSGKGTITSVLDGITYAINVKADILCMSLGTPRELPQIMTSRLKKAYNEGVTIVCATGNNGIQGVNYPASYDYVIGVGGVDKDLNRADFSNFGFDMDIVAPAVDILSTFKDGQYAYMTGTSMASPLVAGGIALVKSYFRNKGIEISPKEMREYFYFLRKNRDRYVGHGLFDVDKFIKSIEFYFENCKR